MAKAKNYSTDFTDGSILPKLVKFAFPVLFALLLQALYGAVDLLVVGRFASSADLSGVSTGSQLMQTVTNIVAAFAMGATVILGQQLGAGKAKDGGKTIGAAVVLFLIIGVALSAVLIIFAPWLAKIMNAPEKAFDMTVSYIRICGGGTVVIVAYNLIGSVFRGIGDSRTPLITVMIACVINIFGDLFNVIVLDLGAAGAAVATVASQAVSVILSILIIRKQTLPFEFDRKYIKFDSSVNKKIFGVGIPIAIQDFLVGLSFLIILAIVNRLGVNASAGTRIAEKVCNFLMLVPSAFMQSMSAFVAQNYGADKFDRAKKSVLYAIILSLSIGVFLSLLTFFKGDLLASVFSDDKDVIAAGYDYLKAYGFDCVLTPVFFCMIGFFNGIGKTKFVMAQGLISAFGVRVPVSYIMSLQKPVSLFKIGLATPCASALQVVMCLVCFYIVCKKEKQKNPDEKTA